MYELLKNILFQLEPETAHDLVIKIAHQFPEFAKILGSNSSSTKKYNLSIGRNNWTFPVGLAAGLDKNAYCYDFFSNLGFGAVEVGTVTPLAQAGNEKPRLWRLKDSESLRNAMGFNNLGAKELITQVSRLKNRQVPLGINIGKNKITPDDLAFKDYQYLYENLKNKCDYIVINVSSPNTPGLRSHQTKEGMEQILKNINYNKEVDLFVKIAPDIDLDVVKTVCEMVKKYDLTGVVATNTTIMPTLGSGGVSGKLLFEKSKIIRKMCLESLREYPDRELIGVGGFSNFSELKEYWQDGGRAVQIYSSFIYQGPKILKDIQKNLDKEFQFYGVQNFDEYLKVITHRKASGI